MGVNEALVPIGAQQEAILEIAALRAQGRSLRAIRDEMRAKGFQISHEGVARILKGRRSRATSRVKVSSHGSVLGSSIAKAMYGFVPSSDSPGDSSSVPDDVSGLSYAAHSGYAARVASMGSRSRNAVDSGDVGSGLGLRRK